MGMRVRQDRRPEDKNQDLSRGHEMKRFKSVELFTGAGGLALGLEKSGWHHVALIERNEHACSTLHLNESLGHPLAKDSRVHSDDVRNIRYAQFGKSVDLVAGGPPCQPFSLGGKHRAYLDNRDMFAEAVRAVRELKPRYFIVENVKGLLRQSFASYFNYIVLHLSYPEVQRRGDEDWQDHLSRLERIHTSGRTKGFLPCRISTAQRRRVWRPAAQAPRFHRGVQVRPWNGVEFPHG